MVCIGRGSDSMSTTSLSLKISKRCIPSNKVHVLKKNSMEQALFINPHTLAVTFEECKRCPACKRTKLNREFYPAGRSVTSSKCRPCYDAYWMKKNDENAKLPIEMHLERTTQRANRRSRYRKSNGPPIELAEVTQLWHACDGCCTHCHHALTFKWSPRAPNFDFAILDRVTTAGNKTYSSNAQFLCHACNTEKGAWDLVDQLQQKIDRLQRRQKKKRRRRQTIEYSSILISA